MQRLHRIFALCPRRGLLRLAAALALLAPVASAQQAPPARYAEPYRPQVHFTPARHWMNDPNGLVYLDGEYHLFYQHNPFGIDWGHMSWGHAVSRDLVRWQELPVAIPETDGVMAFSGSAVVDWQNTSGFGAPGGRPPLVAVFTGARAGRQDQRLAYSTDGGRAWTLYAGNPVLDEGMADFRDPKVFWYAPRREWIMVVAAPLEHRVRFYASPDLKRWTRRSDFGPAGAVGGIWECPDLFALPLDGDFARQRWVLVVNINPGGPAGGSAGQYFLGDFDGARFTAEAPPEAAPRWLDYGPDYYAAVSWTGAPDHERLMIGWMNDWRYAGAIPTRPWRSAQSLPRRVALRTVGGQARLVQQPVAGLEALRRTQRRLADLAVAPGERSLAPEGIGGAALEIIAEFEPGRAEAIGLKVRTGPGEETVVGYDAAAGEVFVDRRRSGEAAFHPAFAARHAAPVALVEGRLRLRVVVDWSSVEVFAQEGAATLTHQIFPRPESTGVSVFAEGGAGRLVALDVWELASAWAAP